ncbi:MAG: helix-turn-helix domain-containing protein [Chitinispirillales bacterium]|nr:helix-turn-helix domain-containing protein [Chitinispirillales bacterium]
MKKPTVTLGREFMTAQDAADMWGVSKSAVYKWISAGKPSAVRLGGRYRLRQSDVEAFEAAAKREGA